MLQLEPFDRFSCPVNQRRRAIAVGAVVFLHVAGLWALQSGLVQQAIEVVVPAQAIIVAEFIPAAPPVPFVQPPAPVLPKVTAPRPVPIMRQNIIQNIIPNIQNIQNTPIISTPMGAATAPEPVPSPPAPEPPPAPPKIELPSSNAAYLQNPAPNYPAISKRMGEHGKVVLRVLISADGLPQKIELHQSSGYDRLDRQAQDAVMRWRFIPGKRNGVAEAMWNIVPIHFILE